MIISKTPLRASFFGGGTDFADYYKNSKYGYGSVISAALDMHVYITLNKRFDDKIRVVYNGNELVESVDEIRHNIIREAMRITGIERGVEIVYTADLPMTNLGVGLASSSALAVGVLNVLHAYKGEYISADGLAREAIDIEINRLGQQIGIQDQYAVSHGGFHRYFFNSDDTVTVVPALYNNKICMDLQGNLQMYYTGKARDSRAIFKEQKKNIKNKKEEVFDPLIKATEKAYRYLQQGDIDLWGELLHSTWEIKKQFAMGVSNPEIDQMYDRARKAGALGGKILGAGGGGFLLLYVKPERQQAVRNCLAEYREIPFRMDMQGSRIIFVD